MTPLDPGTLFRSLLLLVLVASTACAQSFYTNTPVVELTPSNFRSQVLNTRHPTIVEFYAPWCGHCNNLKADYIKAANALKGIANLAAINCDEESNRRICDEYGVKGYPSLKIFGPTKRSKPGKSDFVTDYNGARSAKAIKEALLDRMSVAEVKTISAVEKLNAKFSHRPRVVLVGGSKHPSATAPPLLKSLAIEFDQRAYLKNKDESPVFAYLPPKKVKNPEESSYLIVYEANNTKSEIVYKDSMARSSIRDFLFKYFDIADPLDPKEKKLLTSAKRKQIRERRLKLNAEKAEQKPEEEVEEKVEEVPVEQVKEAVKEKKVKTKSTKKSKSAKPKEKKSKKKLEKKTQTKKEKVVSQVSEPTSTEAAPVITKPAFSITSNTRDAMITGGTNIKLKTGGIGETRIYNISDLQKNCLQKDSKPCVLAAVGLNNQIPAFRLFNGIRTELSSRAEIEYQHKNVKWAYLVDMSQDVSGKDQPSYLAHALGMRNYFPSGWENSKDKANEGFQKQLIERLGMDHLNGDTKYWNHPPGCVYINGREGWIVNFPEYTEVGTDSVIKFVSDTGSGKNKDQRKPIPKELTQGAGETNRDEL